VLTDEDVREILRLIDESELDELRIETEGFSLHVLRGAAGPAIREAVEGEDAEGAAATVAAPQPGGADGVAIKAPMLGVFYRAEAPGATPFVEAGGRVEPDTVVCLIEVMKMMNSVPAGVSGTIVEVCAENAALVEYGQPLFRVEPDR
jgi:acetyl-CoA carboxylase biotin carboxyl carrier protein